MRILISNDDGINSTGIQVLARKLMVLGEVTVVAPDSERSATGHAITMHKPLRVNEVLMDGGQIKAYSVDGTPADCIKMGVDILLDDKPDIILTGINRGANLGTDVLYSGTVSAAIEGSILGIPSAAFSLEDGEKMEYDYAGKVALKVAKLMMEYQLGQGVLINVNVPNSEASNINGIKVTHLGARKYSDNYVKRQDPRGRTYYWLAGDPVDENSTENTDIKAINNNYVSITPIHYNLTDYELIDAINTWIDKI